MSIINSLINGFLDLSFLLPIGDEVAVFDSETFEQVFVNARPMRALVKPSSRTMEHPIENGQSIADHRIINPLEIEMPVLVSAEFYNSVFNDVVFLFENATLLTVQTKFGTYENMFITDLPHEEEPDKFDSISMLLRFKEVLFSNGSPSRYQPPPASPSPNTASLFSSLLSGEITPIVTTALSVQSYVKALATFSR